MAAICLFSPAAYADVPEEQCPPAQDCVPELIDTEGDLATVWDMVLKVDQDLKDLKAHDPEAREGLLRVEADIEELKERVTRIEARIDVVEGDIRYLKREIGKILARLERLEARVERLEVRVTRVEDRIAEIEALLGEVIAAQNVCFAGGYVSVGLDVHPPIGTILPTPISPTAGGGGLQGCETVLKGYTAYVGVDAILLSGVGFDGGLAIYKKGKKGKSAHGVIVTGGSARYGVVFAGMSHAAQLDGVKIGSYHRWTVFSGKHRSFDIVLSPGVRAGVAARVGDSGGFLGLRMPISFQWREKTGELSNE